MAESCDSLAGTVRSQATINKNAFCCRPLLLPLETRARSEQLCSDELIQVKFDKGSVIALERREKDVCPVSNAIQYLMECCTPRNLGKMFDKSFSFVNPDLHLALFKLCLYFCCS